MIPELEGITKEQPGLVEIRSVGSWVIHYCYNCSTNTHAVHREYGAAMVLINTKIVVSTMSSIKSNDNFNLCI